MQTHRDSDFNSNWLDDLKRKASRMKADGKSTIAGGAEGELPIEQWDSHGVAVRKMPDDEHGILRISIGGGDTPVGVNYCVFRGDHGQCIDLLRRALAALENPES